MYRPSSSNSLLLYLCSAVLAAAVVWIFFKNYQKGDGANPAGGSPTTTNTSGRASLAPANDEKMQELERSYRYAVGYFKANPTAYDIALDKFTTLKTKGNGTQYEKLAADEIAHILDQKGKAQSDTMRDLELKARRLMTEGKPKQALDMVRNYRGPFMEETVVQRAKLATDMSKSAPTAQPKQALKPPPAAAAVEKPNPAPEAPKADKDSDVAKFQSKIVAALLKNRSSTAQRMSKSLLNNPAFAQEASLRHLAAISEAFAKREQAIVGAFRNDIGKTVAVRFAKGEEKLTVRKIEGSEIVAEKEIKDGKITGTIGRRFRAKDLSLREQLQRIMKSDIKHREVVCGLLASRHGKKKTAREYFSQADAEIADIFLAALDKNAAE